MYIKFIVVRFSFRFYDELYIYICVCVVCVWQILVSCFDNKLYFTPRVIYQSLSKSYHICSKRGDPYRRSMTFIDYKM